MALNLKISKENRRCRSGQQRIVLMAIEPITNSVFARKSLSTHLPQETVAELSVEFIDFYRSRIKCKSIVEKCPNHLL